MLYGFLALLLAEVILLVRLAVSSERSSGEGAIGAAMGFFAIFAASAVVDLSFGIVWLIVRHHR